MPEATTTVDVESVREEVDDAARLVLDDVLVEDVSIDGMCGVY